MKALTFEGNARVRRATFQERSTFPMEAACLIANAARETLAPIFRSPVALRLLEPKIPDRASWQAICAQALLFAIRGDDGEAAFVLRPHDALALAGAVFGEPAQGERMLSSIERTVLSRIVAALKLSLAPIQRVDASSAPVRVMRLDDFVVYFELLLEMPVQARIGIALSRDPQTIAAAEVTSEHLLDMEIDVSLQSKIGDFPAARIAALRAGEVLPTIADGNGWLMLGSRALRRAECGYFEDHFAAVVC